MAFKNTLGEQKEIFSNQGCLQRTLKKNVKQWLLKVGLSLLSSIENLPRTE